jgi:Undecaprenyl-phosphate glucose phosphotransferase
MGIRPIGFIEDSPNTYCADLDVVGKVADLPRLIQKYGVGHVFIALPAKRMHEARAVFEAVGQSLVDIRLVPDIPGLATLSLRSTHLDGQQVIDLRESPHFGVNILVKRGMDIALSALALIILSPVLAAVAIAVRCSSRGPILYRQERCGLNGASFQMLKFRSMKVDAESSRTTSVGKFIRKTSLDELPQFWNVLMGDMSLVGPRPERPVFITRFSKTIPNYMTRHAVKAGITGWAQVHGWRGNTSLRKRLQYDLYYITHWTPMLDIRILWMTIFKGFVHENAY